MIESQASTASAGRVQSSKATFHTCLLVNALETEPAPGACSDREHVPTAARQASAPNLGSEGRYDSPELSPIRVTPVRGCCRRHILTALRPGTRACLLTPPAISPCPTGIWVVALGGGGVIGRPVTPAGHNSARPPGSIGQGPGGMSTRQPARLAMVPSG
jgi:hypothetical protein